jgi:hypothetical protein
MDPLGLVKQHGLNKSPEIETVVYFVGMYATTGHYVKGVKSCTHKYVHKKKP